MNDLSRFCLWTSSGAAGYVGTELTKQLLNKGYTVRAVCIFCLEHPGALLITTHGVSIAVVQEIEGFVKPVFEDVASHINICRR